MPSDSSARKGEQPPDSINELVTISEYGFLRVDGPFIVDKEETIWTVRVPTHPDDALSPNTGTVTALRQSEGESAALIADGTTVGGGTVTHVAELGDEEMLRIAIDQYLAGKDDD